MDDELHGTPTNSTPLLATSAPRMKPPPLRVLLKWYLRNLEQRPVLTKAITSGVIAAFSDVTSQLIVQSGRSGDKHYSWRSTTAFAAFSMIVTGPITHYIYQFLEGIVPRQSNFSSLKKAVLDRLMFAPPYLLALFYFVARMEGKSHQQAWQQVKAVYWPALIKNLVVWGAAQYVNMSYVPIQYRVLFGNAVALLWNMYLAIIRRIKYIISILSIFYELHILNCGCKGSASSR